MIYDGLVKLDRDSRSSRRWRSRGPSARTASTLTFKLRRDVKWHDGRPFTADDVLFTYADDDQSEDARRPSRRGSCT